MSDKKYTITRKYIKKDGTSVEKVYNWKKYGDFHCQICNKNLSYSSKPKHIKSVNHLRLKNYYIQLNKLKKETELKSEEILNKQL
jgi:hypothetical protein